MAMKMGVWKTGFWKGRKYGYELDNFGNLKLSYFPQGGLASSAQIEEAAGRIIIKRANMHPNDGSAFSDLLTYVEKRAGRKRIEVELMSSEAEWDKKLDELKNRGYEISGEGSVSGYHTFRAVKHKEK